MVVIIISFFIKLNKNQGRIQGGGQCPALESLREGVFAPLEILCSEEHKSKLGFPLNPPQHKFPNILIKQNVVYDPDKDKIKVK